MNCQAYSIIVMTTTGVEWGSRAAIFEFKTPFVIMASPGEDASPHVNSLSIILTSFGLPHLESALPGKLYTYCCFSFEVIL